GLLREANPSIVACAEPRCPLGARETDPEVSWLSHQLRIERPYVSRREHTQPPNADEPNGTGGRNARTNHEKTNNHCGNPVVRGGIGSGKLQLIRGRRQRGAR